MQVIINKLYEVITNIIKFIPTKDLVLVFISIIFGLLLRSWDHNRQANKESLNNLREYFMTSVKPTICQILEDRSNRMRAYMNFIDHNNKTIDILKYHKKLHFLITSLSTLLFPLVTVTRLEKTSCYHKRLISYHWLINYIIDIYWETFPNVGIIALDQESRKKYADFVTAVDLVLSSLELILFTPNCEDDKKKFKDDIEMIELKVKNLGLKDEENYLFNWKDYNEKIEWGINKKK